MAGAENPVCLPCLTPSPHPQCRPQSCLKTAGPLPTLIACFLLHSTYVPVPSKIKVKKNQVSGGSGPRPLSSGPFARLRRMTERMPVPPGSRLRETVASAGDTSPGKEATCESTGQSHGRDGPQGGSALRPSWGLKRLPRTNLTPSPRPFPGAARGSLRKRALCGLGSPPHWAPGSCG